MFINIYKSSFINFLCLSFWKKKRKLAALCKSRMIGVANIVTVKNKPFHAFDRQVTRNHNVLLHGVMTRGFKSGRLWKRLGRRVNWSSMVHHKTITVSVFATIMPSGSKSEILSLKIKDTPSMAIILKHNILGYKPHYFVCLFWHSALISIEILSAIIRR